VVTSNVKALGAAVQVTTCRVYVGPRTVAQLVLLVILQTRFPRYDYQRLCLKTLTLDSSVPHFARHPADVRRILLN